jgi:hypothetical protein
LEVPVSIRRLTLLIGLLLLAGGCGSEPSAPAPSKQSVADVLDLLGQQAIRDGFTDQGLMLGLAARVAKFGVEPSVVAIKVGTSSLRYQGFVTVMTLPGRDAIPAFEVRAFIGWSGEGDATKVLLVGSGGSAASIVPPPPPGTRPAVMPDPGSSAMVMYMDGMKGWRWVGVAGSVRLVEDSQGGACPQTPPGLTCTTGSYAVLLDGTLKMLSAADREITTPVSIPRSVVNAVTLH